MSRKREKKQVYVQLKNKIESTASIKGVFIKDVNGNVLVEFNPDTWIKLYLNGDHKKLCNEFLRILHYLDKKLYAKPNAEIKSFINTFIDNFLFLFCKPEFAIPVDCFFPLLNVKKTLINIIALSSFKTSDIWITMLSQKAENFLKILVLYSPRNSVILDIAKLFETAGDLSSVWWSYCWLTATGFGSETVYKMILKHIEYFDDRYVFFGLSSLNGYFHSTYLDSMHEKTYKAKLNKCIQNMFSDVKIINKPSKKNIAIVTGKWYQCAVYKSLAPYVESLKPDYDLTLIHLGEPRNNLYKSMFKNVISIRMTDDKIDLADIQSNEFNAAYYPDIGMTQESIILSNIRIAPVQIMGYGHPASTYGSKIDYFIGGKDVENIKETRNNYSERLVLIPGIGAHPVYPDYNVTKTDVSNKVFIINCAWGATKVNYPLLETLKEILNKSKKTLLFRFFPNGKLSQTSSFPAFVLDIEAVLGELHSHVLPNMSYQKYMNIMEKGNISLDSYPFGGYNTIVDSLYLGKPIVTWKGSKACNRIASATLMNIGLSDLVAKSRNEYIEKSLRLINDDSYLEEITDKIGTIDLKKRIIQSEYPEYFKKAVDYLIENHYRLKAEKSKEPIFIK